MAFVEVLVHASNDDLKEEFNRQRSLRFKKT